MSTEHQQYSTENQADRIKEYAERHGIDIVHTYADEGKSGLNIGGREGLQRLLEDVRTRRVDFEFILVYDVSRWGRFQDADESAYYEFLCKQAGLKVIYCAEQFDNDGSPVATIVKGVKRAMAGEYSRELSAKVFAGHPSKLAHLVVGAATWRAFDALDRLLAAGVAPAALHVHLGHTRPTGTIRHPFARYHPMLHSKAYLLDMGDGQAAAFVGSHNLTGFALHGKNGEAGVLLEGPANAPQFVALRQHVDEAVRQAVPYDPGMKEAYAWWTMQFIDGLYAEANGDLPKDAENMRTIVVLAAYTSGRLPRPGQIIYFEIPEALDRIQSMQAEVHIYVFPTLPPTSSLALASLGTAIARLSCKVEGIEAGRGGIELRADWEIDNRRRPELKPTIPPFRPTPGSGMQQVRVRVQGAVASQYEYLFDPGKIAWAPIYDPDGALVATTYEESAPGTELTLFDTQARLDLPWQRVRGLPRVKPAGSDARQLALWESTPESEAFILFSPRRRQLTQRRERSDKADTP